MASRDQLRQHLLAILALPDTDSLSGEDRAALRRLADDDHTPPKPYADEVETLLARPAVSELSEVVGSLGHHDRGLIEDGITGKAIPRAVRWLCTTGCCPDEPGDEHGPFNRVRCPNTGRPLVPVSAR